MAIFHPIDGRRGFVPIWDCESIDINYSVGLPVRDGDVVRRVQTIWACSIENDRSLLSWYLVILDVMGGPVEVERVLPGDRSRQC